MSNSLIAELCGWASDDIVPADCRESLLEAADALRDARAEVAELTVDIGNLAEIINANVRRAERAEAERDAAREALIACNDHAADAPFGTAADPYLTKIQKAARAALSSAVPGEDITP